MEPTASSSSHPRRRPSSLQIRSRSGTGSGNKNSGEIVDLWNIFAPKSQPTIVTPEMAFYCFDVLISELKNTAPTIAVDIPTSSFPMFVTWTKWGREDVIRGSLGTFDPIPLMAALGEFAISSALKDNRFKPITSDEIPDLNVTVSILWNFEQGKHFLDWTIGVHGLKLVLQGRRKEKDKRIEANFLPEYPVGTGWTKVETIDALMRAAGFIGKITGAERQAIKITRFQTQKITQTYDDFNQFRNWKTRNPADDDDYAEQRKYSSLTTGIKSARY